MKKAGRFFAAALIGLTAIAATGCLTHDRGVHRGAPIEKQEPHKKPPHK